MKSLTKQGCLNFGVFILIILITNATFPQSYSLTFRKGDALRLMLWQPWRIADGKAQITNLNGDYPIDSRGYVLLPLIGEIKVVGHNTKTLAELLKEKYSPYIQDPFIIVTPLIRITLQGAVNRPGAYLISPTSSLWELIELAGGPSENSNLKKMMVERGGRIVNKNLLRSFENGYSLQEVGIVSGDQIIIPSRHPFGWKDALNLVSFGLSIAVVYLQISR